MKTWQRDARPPYRRRERTKRTLMMVDTPDTVTPPSTYLVTAGQLEKAKKSHPRVVSSGMSARAVKRKGFGISDL